MKFKADKFVKELDMYGQQINFWYKGSLVYSTIVGVIISIVISIFMLIYSVLFIIDILQADKPTIIEVTEALDKPPKYFWTSDYISYFDPEGPIPPFNVFSNKSILFQMSIGFEDIRTNHVLEYDPSLISLQMLRSDKKQGSEPLFYDYCKRFFTESNEIYKFHELDKSLCIYSDFITDDIFTGENFKALNISINACKNDTWYYEPLEMNMEYNVLKMRYDSIVRNKNYTQIIESEPEEINYGSRVRITKVSTDEIVKCKPKAEIIQYLRNNRIVLNYINTMYNVSNKETPISYFIDKKKFSLSSMITQSVSLFFKNDIFKSFTGLIPYSLVTNPVRHYYLNFETEITKYGDFDYDKSDFLIRLYIQSSKIVTDVKRVYPNIFNVMGTLGGLSKMIMLIFTLFVSGWANYKLKENLINDLYAVIDPHKDDLIKLKFTDYMVLRRDKKHVPNKILENVITDEIIDNIWKESDQTKRESLDGKYEVIYEAYKYQAYCGLTYSFKELFMSVFCKCCISKKLRDKNKTYEKAWDKLENDTDFLSIIRALQEFDNIKKFFFDNAQINIFEAFKNQEIIFDQIQENNEANKNSKDNENNEEFRLKQLQKESIELTKSLEWFTQNKPNQLDHKLLLNALDYQDEIVNNFLKDSDKNRQVTQEVSKKDNNEGMKPLTENELKNILKAFKKN